MTRVYRVEKPDTRIGPYNSDWDRVYELAWSHQDSRHPSAYIEFGRKPVQSEKFGFSSMQQLVAWFGGWLPILINEGFRVAVYPDVSITANGRYQVMFEEGE